MKLSRKEILDLNIDNVVVSNTYPYVFENTADPLRYIFYMTFHFDLLVLPHLLVGVLLPLVDYIDSYTFWSCMQHGNCVCTRTGTVHSTPALPRRVTIYYSKTMSIRFIVDLITVK